MFFPQACLVGYQNSACEHKGNHSKEIPDPHGPWAIRARSAAAIFLCACVVFERRCLKFTGQNYNFSNACSKNSMFF